MWILYRVELKSVSFAIITELDRLISTERSAVLVGKNNLTNSVAFDYVRRNQSNVR